MSSLVDTKYLALGGVGALVLVLFVLYPMFSGFTGGDGTETISEERLPVPVVEGQSEPSDSVERLLPDLFPIVVIVMFVVMAIHLFGGLRI